MLVIRRLEPTDESGLAAFFVACAADADTRRYFHPHPLTPGFAADLCRRIPGMKDRYFVAELARRVVGYAMLRGWDEGYAAPSFGGCVHPRLRGAGLGHILLDACVNESRDARATSLRLTVARGNEAGIHLYRKFGFDLHPKDAENLMGLLDLVGPAIVAPVPRPGPDIVAAWMKSQSLAAA